MTEPETSHSDSWQPEDAELMARCRDGDLGAFQQLVERHQNRLVNFFHRLGVYTDSEDLVQETFLKIFQARHRYRRRAKWTTYLYRVARNVYVDDYRKRQRRRTAMASLANDRPAAADDQRQVIPDGDGMDIQAALDRLSPKLRIVVVLAFFEGQDYRSIARILRIPGGTVKSRMHLAMDKLREFLNTS